MAPQTRPKIRLIHNLARTGSTLICKCLGAMERIALLSEIHPLGAKMYNPLDQAHRWHQLLSDADIRKVAGKTLAFPEAIKIIDDASRRKKRTLVIRDWAHLDFHAQPFLPRPSGQLSLRAALLKRFEPLSVFTIRHPIDTWLSLSRLNVLAQPIAEGRFSIESFLAGYHRFAQMAKEGVVIRYEDFVADPDSELRRACAALEIPFDAGYAQRWAGNTKITGDVSGSRGQAQIAKLERRACDLVTVAKFENNAQYQEAVKLLGY